VTHVEKAPRSDRKKSTEKRRRLAPLWRAIIETGFIIFLFYSNLLMGEFTRSNDAHAKTILFAVQDIFTIRNFCIGAISAVIGYMVVEFLRKRF
jgi:hypothetical protein